MCAIFTHERFSSQLNNSGKFVVFWEMTLFYYCGRLDKHEKEETKII